MGQRLQLHQLLKTITDNVYFQPPTNVQLKYPCIIYNRDSIRTEFAGDRPYAHTTRYMVTVIDRDPDNEIVDKVANLPMSLFNRFYTADDLNHDVFSLYF